MADAHEFLAGVIEGFYGQPWSQAERFQLFDWLKNWGLNTYFYAPKDDLKHRALWRELYSQEEAEEMRSLIEACRARGLRFIYGIAPGLDIKYSEDWEITVLKVKLEQLQKLGCQDFAILFDDIPDQMRLEDRKKFESFSKAHCHVANAVFGLLETDRFLFCPTPYCRRMVNAQLGGENYLATVGKRLMARIDVLWTGPEIISEEISVDHIRVVAAELRRKPVIWDNLHANDYDRQRFFVGPYSGRAPELKKEVAGILSNPNCDFPLNYVPIRTLSMYVSESVENARGIYAQAMREWSEQFRTVRGPMSFGDLLLFGDCFYLPHHDGVGAERLFSRIQEALRNGGTVPDVTILRRFCAELAELKNRRLFYALCRQAWDLREELDLLEKFLSSSKSDFQSDFHLPKTFRGGFVSRLQKLLKQNEGGGFHA